jgi:hypothetical protein
VKQTATLYCQLVILGTVHGWEDYSKMRDRGIKLEDLELFNWFRDQDCWLVFFFGRLRGFRIP